MKKIRKFKMLSIMLTVVILICSISISAQAQVSKDTYLLNAGFPQYLIDEMSDMQKDIIYENSKNKIVRFAGYETQSFVLDENEKLSPIETRGGTISSSDLTISVFGTYTINSSGTVLYSSVYPNFVWHKAVKVKNDSFSMAMYSGWEARPGEENLRLHLLNSSGQSAQYVDLNPTESHDSGYSYKVPSNTGFMQGMYAGYAYYNIDKKSSSASPRISLHYVHDTSPLFNVSYSISLSFFGISLSANSNKYLYEMSGNYNVNGLA